MAKTKMIFSETLGRKESASGIGEIAARFVIVHEGREDEANSLMKSLDGIKHQQLALMIQYVGDPRLVEKFASASMKSEVRVRDGVVLIGEELLEQRIRQMTEMKPEGYKDFIREFEAGLNAIRLFHAVESGKSIDPHRARMSA